MGQRTPSSGVIAIKCCCSNAVGVFACSCRAVTRSRDVGERSSEHHGRPVVLDYLRSDEQCLKLAVRAQQSDIQRRALPGLLAASCQSCARQRSIRLRKRSKNRWLADELAPVAKPVHLIRPTIVSRHDSSRSQEPGHSRLPGMAKSFLLGGRPLRRLAIL